MNTKAVTAGPSPAAGRVPGGMQMPAASVADKAPPGLVQRYAAQLGVEPGKLMQSLKDTAFKQPYKDGKAGPEVTDAQMMALLVVSEQYGLNPWLKEIYAFPAKGGGIVPIIGVDGWIHLINSQPTLKSITFEYGPQDGPEDNPLANYWVETSITRSDRSEPITVREYYAECYRNTDPWNTTGRRMTRHKSLIQCGRVAFGYGGIYDPDEGESVYERMRTVEGSATTVEPRGKPPTREPQARTMIAPPNSAEPPVSAAEPQESPTAQLRKALDKSGVPENALLAHFQVGTFDDLTAVQITEALEWIERVNPAP